MGRQERVGRARSQISDLMDARLAGARREQALKPPHVARASALQQLRAKILLRVHVGDEPPGWLRRFTAATGEETTGAW